MKIELTEVVSGNIKAIGYSEEAQTLHVKFTSGQTYEYAPVKKEMFENMKNSKSKGKFFAANIRNNKEISYKKLEPEAPKECQK